MASVLFKVAQLTTQQVLLFEMAQWLADSDKTWFIRHALFTLNQY